MRVLLTSGMGATGALIRWYNWSWAAHAALLLDDGQVLDATPSRGVALHEPDIYAREQAFDLVLPDGTPFPKEVLDRAEAWARSQEGDHYDWGGICALALRSDDWHTPGRWFCSELVIGAFEAAGLPLVQTDHLDRISPRDLLLSPYLKLVWERRR